MFEEYIIAVKHTCTAFLKMLKSLFPRGPIWNFLIRDCPVEQDPEWVYLSTYQEDNFEGGTVNTWWDSAFTGLAGKTVEERPPGSGNYVYIGNSSTLVDLTPSGFLISGDFQLEFENIIGTSGSGNTSVHLDLYDSTNTTRIADILSIISSGNNRVRLILQGESDQVYTGSAWANYDSIKIRLTRSSGVISGSYNINDTGWVTFSTTITYSLDMVARIETADDVGTSYIRMQGTGFPLTPTSAYSQTGWSLLGLLMSCFASELYRFGEAFVNLQNQAVPGLSTDEGLLQDWERIAGLPDECSEFGLTEEQRQINVHQKIYSDYPGLSAQFFIDYAAGFNVTITVTNQPAGTPFRVSNKLPGTIQRVSRMPTNDIDGSRLVSVGAQYVWVVDVITDPDGNQDLVECNFQKMKPAYTQLVFNKLP